MKKHLILFFAGVILSYGNIKAQTVPDKKEILKVTLHVNDYFMKKYADYRTPSFVKKVVRPSNIWTRSVYYEGLMALYSIYPADEYYLYAKEWADYHQWGFHRGTTTRNADNYCASQIYLDLYNICPDPEKNTENESQYGYAGQYSTNKRLVVDRCYPDGDAYICQNGETYRRTEVLRQNVGYVRIYP